MKLLGKITYSKIFIIVLLLPLIILLLDLVNISKIIPFTFNFDWLSFVGGYISFVATIILATVAIKQNDRLNEINKKIIESNVIANCYSKIIFSDKHFLQKKEIFRIRICAWRNYVYTKYGCC